MIDSSDLLLIKRQWSRLVAGLGNSSTTKQAPHNIPQQRLSRFRRAHDQLQQAWLKNKKLSTDPIAAENVRICLESLKHILLDEIQAPAPHLCISIAATSRVYSAVAKVAISSSNEGVTHEALDFFSTLINSEEGEFLEDYSFANTLTNFVDRISSSRSVLASVQTEGDIVEILFGIATKLRLQPAILPVWFRPRVQEAGTALENHSDGASLSKPVKTEFPLFYFLLDYVHHDGRVGDFARTGILYIIESAIHTEELEKWIVESDLATLMASGLGALYSQLSRKLVLSFSEDSVPAVVAFSEISRPQPTYDAVETSSARFQAHLGAFLSYLVFWQDALEHCTSSDVKQTLLDHFQLLFLQQLLYPSLVESSDTDGGSSVAVLTYLRCILESISHPDLVQLILQYLLALPDPPADDLSISRPPTLARRRKSQSLIINLAKGEEKPSPILFNLVDLILSSLQSHNQQTVTATLRLFSVIIRTQHQYATSTLIKIQPLAAASIKRTLGTHNLEVDTLLCMAEEMATQDGLEESYETHLQDVRNMLETHSCSIRLLALPGTEYFANQTTPSEKIKLKPVEAHTIAVDDPLIAQLLSLLHDFLVNDIETNLSLTQAITTVASCGYTRLEGWVLGDDINDEYPSQETCSEDHVLESDSVRMICSSPIWKGGQKPKHLPLNLARREPIRSTSSTSPIFAMLNSLVNQIESFRKNIPDFDIYLAERKHIFRIGEEIESALSETPASVRKSDDRTRTPTTVALQTPPHTIGSISQRLTAEESSSNLVSGSSSPRGRQHNDPSASTLMGRLSHLRNSPSPSPSKFNARPYSSSPFRTKDKAIPSTPPKPVTPIGPPDALLQKIKFPPRPSSILPLHHTTPLGGSSETSSVRSESIGPEPGKPDEAREVSLGHLLTNVIVLQEFVLELAAMVEVRATLFDEVRFI